MELYKGLPIHLFAAKDDWLNWLFANHATQSGVWVKLAKKGSGLATIGYDEALEGALRYGWIDGLINKWDDACYVTRFTPRKAKSVWSRTNCDLVERLTAEGLMTPGGLAPVEAAKLDGRWEAAYDGQKSIEVPSDFQAALDENAGASAAFDALDKANRYSFLYRIQTAAKAETRRSRIEKFIAMLTAGEVYHPKK